MPRKPFVFFEDVPVRPVIAAITGAAERTVEARHFEIEIVQALDVAGQNHSANALESRGIHAQRQAAGKALPGHHGVIGRAEELHHAITTELREVISAHGR